MAGAWVELATMYPHRFEALNGGVGETGFQAWQRVLGDLSAAHINTGILRLRRSAPRHCPTVGEFRAGCFAQPEELGLPPVRTAYVAAARGDWSAPIVWHAAQRLATEEGISRMELRASSEAEVFPAFERVYLRLVQEVQCGTRFEHPTHAGQARISHDPVHIDPAYADPQRAREAFFRYGRKGEGRQ